MTTPAKPKVLTIIPFIDLWPEFTQMAMLDTMAQDYPTDLLLIANDCSQETRGHVEAACANPRIRMWWHKPALPTLDASWNAGLDAAWEDGYDLAWVPNADVRLHPKTLSLLIEGLQKHDLLFVSAVNAGKIPEPFVWDLDSRGGPDFSCFLVSKECHRKYPFDPAFTYGGDCDLARRMQLGGDGKRISSVLVPYEHIGGGSATIKHADPERAERLRKMADLHREHYRAKWGGGGINAEAWNFPFNATPTPVGACTTLPDLERHGCRGIPHL